MKEWEGEGEAEGKGDYTIKRIVIGSVSSGTTSTQSYTNLTVRCQTSSQLFKLQFCQYFILS